MIVMGVFVFLWSLLFIIPGIIARFSLQSGVFILADDPSKGIMGASTNQVSYERK